MQKSVISKAKKPKGKLESVVKKAVKDVLSNFGAYQFWPVQTGLGARTLDCIACVPVRITADMVGKTLGAFVGIETKRESISDPTVKQGYTMQQMRASGAVAVLVNNPHDIAVEDQLLRAIKNGYAEGGTFVNLQSPYVRGQMAGE